MSKTYFYTKDVIQDYEKKILEVEKNSSLSSIEKKYLRKSLTKNMNYWTRKIAKSFVDVDETIDRIADSIREEERVNTDHYHKLYKDEINQNISMRVRLLEAEERIKELEEKIVVYETNNTIDVIADHMVALTESFKDFKAEIHTDIPRLITQVIKYETPGLITEYFEEKKKDEQEAENFNRREKEYRNNYRIFELECKNAGRKAEDFAEFVTGYYEPKESLLFPLSDEEKEKLLFLSGLLSRSKRSNQLRKLFGYLLCKQIDVKTIREVEQEKKEEREKDNQDPEIPDTESVMPIVEKLMGPESVSTEKSTASLVSLAAGNVTREIDPKVMEIIERRLVGSSKSNLIKVLRHQDDPAFATKHGKLNSNVKHALINLHKRMTNDELKLVLFELNVKQRQAYYDLMG